MALSDALRNHLAGEMHDFSSRGLSARHPLFGAKGDYDPTDGSGTDDTAALQAWICHAEAIYDQLDRGALHSEVPNSPYHDHSAVVCLLPAGHYKVTGTLMLRRPLWLQGAGWGDAILHTTCNQPILHYERQVDTLQVRAVIRGIGFEGTHVKFSSNAGRESQHGIQITKHPAFLFNNYVDVQDCQLYGLGGAGIHGFFDDTSDPDALGDKFRILGCHFALCGDFAVKLQGRHATAYISGNHIHDCAGGIAMLGILPPSPGAPGLPVSTSVIERNIIEGNTTGFGPPGSATNPAVGIQLAYAFIMRIERNYFERHLNGIYLVDRCAGIQISRNHFDGGDVFFPQESMDNRGNPITRQLSPVYWDGSAHTDVLVEENDVYVPEMPATTALQNWSPPPNTWGTTYPVFPSISGFGHQLIRNPARVMGGAVQDATYDPAAEGTLYLESVARVPEYRRVLIQVTKDPGSTGLSFSNLALPPVTTGAVTSSDDDAGPLLTQETGAAPGSRAGVQSGNFSVVRPGWQPEYITTLAVVSLADVRVWSGLFSSTPAASATPGVLLAGFRYDTGAGDTPVWRCVTANAGAPAITETAVAIVPGQRYILRVRFRDANTVDFYVGGTLVATHTNPVPGPGPLGFANLVTALGASACAIRTGRITVTHNA